MKVIQIENIADKLCFNGNKEYVAYARSNLRCPNCKSNVSIKFRNLEKHALGAVTNLSQTESEEIQSYIRDEKIVASNSFLDYKCPDCRNIIRIYFDAWDEEKDGKIGYELKFAVVENYELEDWKVDFNEQSNNVWKFKMVHKYGSTIEKVGTNLAELLKETRKDAIEMNKQLNEKGENTHNTA